jgi:polyhydroxyalkanoate synthesis regulator phasin
MVSDSVCGDEGATMVRDSLRGYLSLASGLSEVTATRARAAARALVEQGEATAGQVSSLAEDLVSTSRRNRESLSLLVRHEVDQAVRRLGFAPAADNDELTRRVRQLERTVRELQAELRKSGADAGPSSDGQSSARRTSPSGAKRAAKAGSKSTPSKSTPSKSTPSRARGAGKSTAAARKSSTARKSATGSRGATKTTRAKKRT